jgi:hypothetical protein
VYIGNFTVVSNVHAASIFRVEVCKVTFCKRTYDAVSKTTERGKESGDWCHVGANRGSAQGKLSTQPLTEMNTRNLPVGKG